MFGLAGVDRVYNIGILFVHRDLQPWPVLLVLLGHPLARVHPVLGGDVHLSIVDAVHARADLQFPGHESLGETQPPDVTEHHPHVDAERAIGGAAVAAGALGPGRIHDHVHEIVVHLAIAFDHFTQGGLDLVGRHLLGILVVGQVEITAVGAHATVGADLQPGPQPGPAGFFQCGRQGLAVHVQFLHFGVIQLAAFVRQQRVELFLGVDNLFVAKHSFGHFITYFLLRPLPGHSLVFHTAALDPVIHAQLCPREKKKQKVGQLGKGDGHQHDLAA